MTKQTKSHKRATERAERAEEGEHVVTLEWKAPALKKKLEKAAVKGVNRTLKEAVQQAKGHHPGWKSQSGDAEKSIKVLKSAEVDGNEVSGLWGSEGVFYMRFLEHMRGSALRQAGDDVYKRLGKNIREALKN